MSGGESRKRRVVGAMGGVLLLCACGDPAWRNPATGSASTTLAPEVQAVLDEDARAADGAVRTDHLTAAPRPPQPAWAAPLLGRNVRLAFPGLGACIGNTDGLTDRYGSGRGGARVVGWGWDPDLKAPVARVILVDKDFRIAGAGETGVRRLDVSRALPAVVTSDFTGWAAVTAHSAGPLDAYGLKADGKSLCRLGHLEL